MSGLVRRHALAVVLDHEEGAVPFDAEVDSHGRRGVALAVLEQVADQAAELVSRLPRTVAAETADVSMRTRAVARRRIARAIRSSSSTTSTLISTPWHGPAERGLKTGFSAASGCPDQHGAQTRKSRRRHDEQHEHEEEGGNHSGGMAVLAAGAAGGVAMATGDDGDQTVTGKSANAATAAALKATGGGRANSVELDSENGAIWEVEVTKTNGSTVDVRLDENYAVVVIESDQEDPGE